MPSATCDFSAAAVCIITGLRAIAADAHPTRDSILPPPASVELGSDAGPPSGVPNSVPTCSSDAVYAEIRGGIRLADMKKKLEKACIARALVESGGNITRAAGLIGMKRPRLSQLVKQYGLSTVLEDIKS